MNNLSMAVEVRTLIDWLRKRSGPNSGINYRAHDHFREGAASVEIYGSDADFIAKHFHGNGAKVLADALSALVSPPLTAGTEVTTVEDERLREFAETDMDRMGVGEARSMARELLAHRSRPVEAGELVPVAWLIERFTAEGEKLSSSLRFYDPVAEVGPTVKATPLVPASALTASQARVEELESLVEQLKLERVDKTDAWDANAKKNAEIKALSTRLQEAEKALEPFAAEADKIDAIAAQSSDEYDKPLMAWTDDSIVNVRAGDLRRARSALKGEAS